MKFSCRICNCVVHIGQCTEISNVVRAQCSNDEVLGLVKQHMNESPVALGCNCAVDQDHKNIWEVAASLSYDTKEKSYKYVV